MRPTPLVGTALLLALVFGAGRPLSAQTRAFLDAPVVKSQIRVAWDAPAKKITYAVDDDSVLRELPADKLFLAKTSIFITYPRINPLRIQATASATAADDPSQATIAKLIEAIVSLAAIVQPAAAAATRGAEPFRAEARGCAALETAYQRISELSSALYGENTEPAAIRVKVGDWIRAIDTAYAASPAADGPGAIRAGVASIDGFVDEVGNAMKAAERVIARIDKEASLSPGTDACSIGASTVYHLTVLANPRARVEQLRALKATAEDLRDTLRTDYVENRSRWLDGVNYKIGPEIVPTAARMQNVVIRAANVTFQASSSGTLAVSREAAGSAALTVRRYSGVAPEIGVGAVFGFLTAPRYGTSTNETGETIVSRVPDTRVTVAPSILVNFVWRSEAGPFIAPMLQVGVATSKEVPAILLGGGIRLFGLGSNGDVAVGGGLMIGWVKDLQTLAPGSIVRGTKDIEADLAYTPRPSGYFVIQYKF